MRIRKQLFARLGWKCVRCGSSEDLSIDHVDGRSWSLNMAWVKRMQRYWTEFEAGVRLRLLCMPCHGKRSFKQAQARRRRKRLDSRQGRFA